MTKDARSGDRVDLGEELWLLSDEAVLHLVVADIGQKWCIKQDFSLSIAVFS